MVEVRNSYKILFGNTNGKRPLGRPSRIWEDDNKMDLKEIGYEGTSCIQLAHKRVKWRALHNTILTFGFFKRWDIF